jgi:magnesium transporter
VDGGERLNERAEQLAEKLQDALEAADWEMLGNVAEIPAPDLAESIALMGDPKEQAQVLQHLDEALAAEVMDYLEPSLVEEIIEHLPEEKAADLLQRLPSDDAAQIVAELDEEKAEALLSQMTPAEARDVRELLEYPEQSAGRLMTQRYVRLHPSWTVGYALDYLRHVSAEAETMNVLYIVDERARLVGVCSLRELVTSPPTTTLEKIMTTEIISVKPETDQEDVAQLLSRYDLLAIPVLDDLGRMFGIVTIDDIVDVLVSESTEDLLKLGAVDPSSEPYLSLTPWETALKRVRWLVILFFAERLTGSVLRHYETELDKMTALALFIPLLIGTGGNAGSQTTTTITRAIALGEVRLRHFFRVLGRECLTGLLVGLVIGIIGYLNALVWKSPFELALTVAIAQAGIIIWATTVGATLPLLAKRFHVDPAVMSTPFITTFVDATGLILYFLLAKMIMGI